MTRVVDPYEVEREYIGVAPRFVWAKSQWVEMMVWDIISGHLDVFSYIKKCDNIFKKWDKVSILNIQNNEIFERQNIVWVQWRLKKVAIVL